MNAQNHYTLLLLAALLFGCQPASTIQSYGLHYQQYQDFYSLDQVVELMPENVDTAFVRSILGEPIDMGFDFRYLVDSVSPERCAVGAVFHIDENGHIDQRWTGDICE